MGKKKIVFGSLGGLFLFGMLFCMFNIVYTSVNPRVLYDARELALVGGIMCVCASVGMLIFDRVIEDKGRLLKLRKAVFYSTFAVYMVVVVTALFGTAVFPRYYSGSVRSQIAFADRIRMGIAQANFVPFKVITTYVRAYFNGSINRYSVVVNLIGNLVFFMPMGIFLPVIAQKLKINASVTMLIFLVLIELMQLITGLGTFDIDDIFLNFLGFVIVYLIRNTKPVKKLIKL